MTGAPYTGEHAYRVWFRTLDGWSFHDVRADSREQAAESMRGYSEGWNAKADNVERLDAPGPSA